MTRILPFIILNLVLTPFFTFAKEAPFSTQFGKRTNTTSQQNVNLSTPSTSNTPIQKPALASIEHVEIPLVRDPVQQISGSFASADWFVRLPEHIQFVAGSEITLSYRPSPILLPDICTMTVIVNGTKLDSRRVIDHNANTETSTHFAIHVPEEFLKAGWNKISAVCLLQTTGVPCRDVDNPATWLAFERGCFFKVAYRRLPLFHELQRFPHCIAEEQLLHPAPLSSQKTDADPMIGLFLPSKLDDVDLRAFMIAATRISQTGYITEKNYYFGSLSDWKNGSNDRNGIILGRREELTHIGLPTEILSSIESLKPSQGLISEFFTGTDRQPRRWILVTGADDQGFENAALTLGDSHALSTAQETSMIIQNAPTIPAWLEQRSRPGAADITFRRLGVDQVKFRGVFRNEQSLEWQLPPGYQLRKGSNVELRFGHSQALQRPSSAVEVILNGLSVGSVALTPENASSSVARIALPAHITGRDPMTIVFRAYLDIGTVDCGHRNEESAWLTFFGDSEIHAKTEPVTIRGLEDLREILLRDSFLRRTAWIIPSPVSPDDLRILVTHAAFVGSSVLSSPIIWPQITTYSPQHPPDPERLKNRSALLLGSAAQWRQALPPNTPLAVSLDPTQPEKVIIQGHSWALSEFEPSLNFTQLLHSPWSKDEWVVLAGGWASFTTKTLQRLLTDPSILIHMNGSLAALDVKGRMVNYDVYKTQQESFSDLLFRLVTPGGSNEDLNQKSWSYQILQGWSTAWVIAFGCIILLILSVAVWFQVSLLRERQRKRRTANKPEE